MEDPVPFKGGTGILPAVNIYGLESEFTWLISSKLRLDGFLALMDGEIKEDLFTLDVVDFVNSGYGRFTATGVADRASLRVNLKGNEPPKLVDNTTRLLLTHNQRFASGASLISRLDFIHRGEFQYRVYNHPDVDTVPAYDTLGLSFHYDLGVRPLRFSLSATNLTDEDGVNSRFSNPYGLHTTSEELIPPRELIGSIRYRF